MNQNNIATSFLSHNKICIVWRYYNCLYMGAIYSKGRVSDETMIYRTPLYTSLEEALKTLFLEITLPKVGQV